MDHITHDFTAKPNYVPSPEADKLNYIQDEETMETLIKQKQSRGVVSVIDYGYVFYISITHF